MIVSNASRISPFHGTRIETYLLNPPSPSSLTPTWSEPIGTICASGGRPHWPENTARLVELAGAFVRLGLPQETNSHKQQVTRTAIHLDECRQRSFDIVVYLLALNFC